MSRRLVAWACWPTWNPSRRNQYLYQASSP